MGASTGDTATSAGENGAVSRLRVGHALLGLQRMGIGVAPTGYMNREGGDA